MRRALLVLSLATALVAGAGWLTPAIAAAPDEWLQHGHDAGHTYANPGETQLTVAALRAVPPYPGMRPTTVDVGLSDVSDPLIEGVYMFVTSVGWDQESGRLERFDIPTEERLWVHDLSCFGPPVVSSDSILIEDKCTETAPASAQVLSTHDASLQYLAADQLGIVHRGVGYFTNYGGGVYLDPWLITAQDLATQDILWTKTSTSTTDRMLPVLAAGDTLYVTHNQQLEARDVATGDLRWSRTLGLQLSPLAATPGAVYVRWQDGDRHGIASWDAADGHTKWHITTPEADTPFALTPNAVFEAAPDFLAARSTADGSLLWKHKGYPWANHGQPVFAGGVLWAPEQYSDFDAFNARNGNLLLSISGPPGPITVAQGHVFVGSPDGRVFIYAP